jgi:hypothetical protein
MIPKSGCRFSDKIMLKEAGPNDGRLRPPVFLWALLCFRPANGLVNDMNENDIEQGDEQILTFEVSDAALEAAANTLPGAAMSFPNAPTVNVVVVCCGND